MKHKWPHIDAGNYFIVDESLLQLVRGLVGPLDGELFDLCQLGGEWLVAVTGAGRLSLLLLLGSGGRLLLLPRVTQQPGPHQLLQLLVGHGLLAGELLQLAGGQLVDPRHSVARGRGLVQRRQLVEGLDTVGLHLHRATQLACRLT